LLDVVDELVGLGLDPGFVDLSALVAHATARVVSTIRGGAASWVSLNVVVGHTVSAPPSPCQLRSSVTLLSYAYTSPRGSDLGPLVPGQTPTPLRPLTGRYCLR
jgi:hypothetical protein